MIKKIDKKIISIFATVFSLVILFTPMVIYAAYPDRIISCGAVDGSQPACDFNQMMVTINNLIQFLLIYFATPLAAICFAYAGFLYITSAGSAENVSKAKKILTNVIIGYVIALVAWLIVKTILVSLGFSGPMFLDIK